MRALRLLVIAGLLGAAVSSVQAAPVTYQLDPSHTMVLFTWNHFGFSNPTADLPISAGTIVFDDKQPTKSTVEVTLPLSGLDTHVSALDTHLKEPDFFDASKYPTVTFKSTKVQSLGGNTFKVTGDLTVHGVTKSVVLDAKLNKSGVHPMKKLQAIGFDATGTLKRSDFGVAAYVPNVSDEIKLHITTEGSVPKTDAAQ